jgi:flagellar hook-length control protein FliK
LPFVRASATSRIASPATAQATQSKTDANKADETSPFALLVGQVQAKPAAQQKDAQGKDDQSGDKQTDAGTTSQASTAATQTVAQTPVKPAKADKNSKKDDSSATSNDSASAAALQQASAQPQPPLPPQIALTAQQNAATTAANAAANDDAGDDDTQVAAAGAATVAASGQAKAQAGQNAQNSQSAPDIQAADPQADASNIAGQVAGQIAGQPAAKPAGQTKAQPASQASAQTPGQATAQAQAASQDGVDLPTVQADGVQVTKPWQAKAQSPGDAGTGKTDSSQASDSKTADVKQAATPQPQVQAQAANDTPVFKMADVPASTVPMIGGTTPAQQTQSPDAPAVTQNVQVSTAPTPNMPALAVEISAKSQSGAKQFDIRLDPPELGRVEVRLSIDATGKASAHLSADQPQTLDLLQKDAPTLTRALRDAGLDVSQNGLNFSLRQQSGDTGAGNNQGRSTGGRSFSLTATSNVDATSASAAYSASADGRVDIRV